MNGFKQFLRSCVRFFRNMGKRARAMRIKINRSGGIRGIASRTIGGIRRREAGAFVTLGVSALIIIGLPLTIILLAAAKPADKQNAPVTQAQLASAAASSGGDGIVDIAAPTPRPAPTPTPAPTPQPTPTPIMIGKGMTGDVVKRVQERLMELGYMEYDEPTDYYGPITKGAVEIFQRDTGLDVDGYVGETTYDALMREGAPKYMVKVGTEGTDVEELQKRLRELGYIDTATGYFGTDTETAVKKFQDRNGVSPDGMVGEVTRELLYSEEAVANAITYGEKSEEVKKYQQRLYKLGYLTTEPDGNFGRDTVAAVKLFQQLSGVIADGYVGPETKRLLMSSSAQANAITIGMSGDTISRVQSLLKELNYLSGKATGYYGSETEAAVRAFQKNNKLSVDGKVGRQTMLKLTSDNAVRASAPVSSGSGDSSGSSGSSGSQGSSGSNYAGGASASALISYAKTKLGCRYVTGGKGPSKFDCSGFVYYCLNQVGVRQGYMTSKTWRSVDKYQRITSMGSVREGDILVFKMSSSKGHVGIAMSGSQMIHASSSMGKVITSSYATAYWQKYFYCAYRIF